MEKLIPTDDATNELFARAIGILEERFEYSHDEAISLAQKHYERMRPTHEDDDFHHHGPGGIAMRIHYMHLHDEDDDYWRFVQWRTVYLRERQSQSQR